MIKTLFILTSCLSSKRWIKSRHCSLVSSTGFLSSSVRCFKVTPYIIFCKACIFSGFAWACAYCDLLNSTSSIPSSLKNSMLIAFLQANSNYSFSLITLPKPYSSLFLTAARLLAVNSLFFGRVWRWKVSNIISFTWQMNSQVNSPFSSFFYSSSLPCLTIASSLSSSGAHSLMSF